MPRASGGGARRPRAASGPARRRRPRASSARGGDRSARPSLHGPSRSLLASALSTVHRSAMSFFRAGWLAAILLSFTTGVARADPPPAELAKGTPGRKALLDVVRPRVEK